MVLPIKYQKFAQSPFNCNKLTQFIFRLLILILIWNGHVIFSLLIIFQNKTIHDEEIKVPSYSRCSFSMMVKLANYGKILVNDGEMPVNGEMSVLSYTHFTIIYEHFTIIKEHFATIRLK